MHSYSAFRNNLAVVVVLLLGLSSCKGEIEKEQQGLFVITNQSGYDMTLSIFKTEDRRKAPVVISIPNGNSVERIANGGSGLIVYPELFFQGDSIRVVFSDRKQVLHYCTQAQQLTNQCQPSRSLLDLDQYQIESASKNITRYTYTLMPSDYSLAN